MMGYTHCTDDDCNWCFSDGSMSRDGGSITISGYHEDDTILLCTVIMKENCNYLLSYGYNDCTPQIL